MSKGGKRRPIDKRYVSESKVAENWNNIFNKNVEKEIKCQDTLEYITIIN